MNGSIIYRADRLRFILAAALIVPFTVVIAWLAYDGIFLGDSEVRGAWLTPLIGGLYVWLDYVLIAKITWPPELEISPKGIRWSNYAMLQWPASYGWPDIEGPEQTSGAKGVQLLQFVVKATGRKLRLPPSHFGATYDEMAAVISAARGGKPISPDQWRSQHPQHRFRHWLLYWGLPVSLGLVVAIGLGLFRGGHAEPTAQERCFNEKNTYSPQDVRSACNQLLTDSTIGIQERPEAAYEYFNRGYANEHLGNLNQAVADFSEVIRLTPRRADAYYYRWAAYKDLGDDDEAKADFATLSRLNPKFAAEIRSIR